MNRFVQERVNPPAPRTISVDTKGEITCLTTNKDFSMVACAGRQVFKVYTIDEDRFTEKFNLRPAQKPNLNYVAVDLVWSPREENILASASSNGSIVFWDLNRPSKNKQEHIHNQHARAASRLCFHSQENLLLSGGKDRVCKLFDTRRREVVSSFHSVAVLDVQWWPSQQYMFASATENGSVQIWDYRHPQSCLLEFPAHSGPVFALDFHPEDKTLLATGGRDKLIKVWRLPESPFMSTAQPPQAYQIQTIAPVSRVKWRPKRPTQIASVVNAFDLGVNVWELRRPFIPIATFTEHRDVVTSIIWKDEHEFVSGGKDSKLVMHAFKDAVRIVEKVNPVAISLNKGDELALAVNDKKLQPHLESRNSTTSMSSAQTAAAAGERFMKILTSRPSSSKPDKRELFLQDTKSSLFFFEQPLLDFDASWFEYCAKNYILHGKSFEDMCQHNSDVAADRQQIQIMKHWLLMKILFGSSFEPQPNSTFASINRLDTASTIIPRPEVLAGYTNGDHYTENGDNFTSGASEDESDTDIIMGLPTHAIAQTTTHDFLYEDNEIDGFEFEFDDKEETYEDEQDFELPTESFMPSHDLTDAEPHNHNFHPSSHHQTIQHNQNTQARDRQSEPRSPVKVTVIPAAFDVPLWDSISSMVALLNSYADAGDVQTAVCMYIVLGNKIKSHIDEEDLESWVTSYIDLLEKFRLWCESNTIITRCNIKTISHMNQSSTTFHTVCAQCLKSLIGQEGWHCKRCQKITSLCSLCHAPVKGTYIWCQGCAHGGHMSHMKDWFSTNNECPTGCGHQCELT